MDASTAEIITAVGTLLAGLGTLGLLAVASQGLTAWRQQMVGQEEYEIAKGLVKGLMEIRGFLWYVNVAWETYDEEQAKLKVEEKYHESAEKLIKSSSDAVMLWGHDWGQKDEMEGFATALMRVGFNLGNCNADSIKRKEMLGKLQTQTDRIIDWLRKKGLGHPV